MSIEDIVILIISIILSPLGLRYFMIKGEEELKKEEAKKIRQRRCNFYDENL